jgi:signal peptidase
MTSQSPDPEDVPDDGEDTSSQAEPTGESGIEPMSLPATYRAFRESIVGLGTGGQLLWDGFRVIGSVLLILALLLFLTGTTSPFVSVMSGSMEPNIKTGDVVVTAKYDSGDAPFIAKHDGIITVEESRESPGTHKSFGKEGDVIVFEPAGGGTPVIHRAHFWVEENENWADRANSSLTDGADTCEEIVHCPAPNAGYITHGDHNEVYDQVNGRQKPVTEERVIAISLYRIPYIGYFPNGIEILTP